MNDNGHVPFIIKDCALAAIGTGKRATDLRELRHNLQLAHPGCIYYHFWGARLRPRFENPEYVNDFAEWASNGIHDNVLAERLGVISPTDYETLEELRQEVIDVIEERLDEIEVAPWSKPDRQFQFTRSQIVVFDTGMQAVTPEDLVTCLTEMTSGSVFYHYIDARGRTDDGADDFRTWLRGFEGKYDDLCELLADVDPYFISLHNLREQLAQLFTSYFSGRRS